MTTKDNIDRAWTKLIDYAVNDKPQKEFNVTIPIQVNNETWDAYAAAVSHRDILFYCKQGTATYLVDSYGDKNTVELFDWEEDEL